MNPRKTVTAAKHVDLALVSYRDENDQPVPGATIEVITGDKQTLTTGEDGWFILTAVREGVVHRTGLLGLINRFLSIPFYKRLWITLGALGMLGLYIGWAPMLAGSGVLPQFLVTHGTWLSAAGGCVFALGMLATVIYLDVRISIPLLRATRIAQRVVSGDISARFDVEHGAELRRFLSALNLMNAKLTAVLLDVRVNVQGTAEAVTQLTQGSVDLSNRTERQADRVRALFGKASRMELEVIQPDLQGIPRVAVARRSEH